MNGDDGDLYSKFTQHRRIHPVEIQIEIRKRVLV